MQKAKYYKQKLFFHNKKIKIKKLSKERSKMMKKLKQIDNSIEKHIKDMEKRIINISDLNFTYYKKILNNLRSNKFLYGSNNQLININKWSLETVNNSYVYSNSLKKKFNYRKIKPQNNTLNQLPTNNNSTKSNNVSSTNTNSRKSNKVSLTTQTNNNSKKSNNVSSTTQINTNPNN